MSVLRTLCRTASAISRFDGTTADVSRTLVSSLFQQSGLSSFSTSTAFCGGLSSSNASSVTTMPFLATSSHPQTHQVLSAASLSVGSSQIRGFASETGNKEGAADQKQQQPEGQEQQQAGQEQQAGNGSEAGEQPASAEELLAQLKQQEAAAEKMTEQVAQLTDSLKRALAEMENVRARATREVDTAKKFAVQSFIKHVFDVADNLERAAASVPAEALSEEPGKALDADKLRKLLKGMQEGLLATEKILLHTFKQNGVEQYNPLGEKFDPNLHNALFEVPDASKEPGTVGVVTKRGYKLHDRVVRPAEVGVVRAP